MLVRALPGQPARQVTAVAARPEPGRAAPPRPVRGRLTVLYRKPKGLAVTHAAILWGRRFETYCGRVNPGATQAARAVFTRSGAVPVSCEACLRTER